MGPSYKGHPVIRQQNSNGSRIFSLSISVFEWSSKILRAWVPQWKKTSAVGAGTYSTTDYFSAWTIRPSNFFSCQWQPLLFFSVATLPSGISMHSVRPGPVSGQSHTGVHGCNSNLHGCPGFIQGVICSELGAHTM